jgi:hypothetical protein
VAEISDNVRELVRGRVTTMDHVEVLMRLFEAGGAPVSSRDIERTARLGPQTVARCAMELVRAELATVDAATASFAFAPGTPDDRSAVAELATLYHQRPVTLVKLVYAQPPAPLRSFADAFRLRDEPEDT